LTAWRDDGREEVQQELINAWPSFDPAAYVDAVLQHLLPSAGTRLPLTVGPAQAPYLARLPWARTVVYEAAGAELELAGLPQSIVELTVRSSRSQTLAGLSTAHALKILTIEHCHELETLPSLARLEELRHVTLTDLPSIDSLAGLRESRGVRHLALAQLPSVRELGLGSWPHVTHVTVSRCSSMEEIGSSTELTELRALQLTGVALRDLSSLPDVPKLATISLTQLARLRSLEGINRAPDLRSVHVTGCPGLSDLAALASLRNVVVLSLTRNPAIRDISPLAKMHQLVELDLSDSAGVRSAKPLAELPKLDRLDLRGCWLGIDLAGLDHVSDIEFPFPA
jgi:Leucine-rich repeat (LRR) protein